LISYPLANKYKTGNCRSKWSIDSRGRSWNHYWSEPRKL